MHKQDLVNRFVGIADHKMPFRTSPGIKLLSLVGRPSALAAYPVHLGCVYRVVFICKLLTIVTKQCMHMYAYLQGIGVVNDHDKACFCHAGS